jgi:uncharacterized repeat protein (TIGR01451 family)
MRRLLILTLAALAAVPVVGTGVARAEDTADLSIGVSASAEPTTATSDLTYTITVVNNGPSTAEHVSIYDTLPADVMLISVSGRGRYDEPTNRVIYHIGSVVAGRTLVRTIVIRPIRPSSITDSVVASSRTSDPTTPNYSSVDSTVVAEPGVAYIGVRGDSGLMPPFHSVPLGGTVQWNIFGSSSDAPHRITDAHDLGILDSGPISPVHYYRYDFTWSGEIRTMDDPIYPANVGKLVIPVQVSPSSGSVSSEFTLTWATAPLPTGYTEDVQIKRPGSSTWERFIHGTSGESTTFVPDVAGEYAFRDRIRRISNRNHSRFGPPVTFTVTP